MTDRVMSVPEVYSNNCVNSIEGAVGALAGVARVAVDLETRTVAVSYTEDAVSYADIVGAIEGQGYDVRSDLWLG